MHATSAPTFGIQVTTRGDVGEKMIRYAQDKISRVARRHTKDPILSLRIKLTAEPNPSRGRPAIAQASLDVNGRLIRGHVAGVGMQAAIDLLEERLRDQLERLADRREALRKRGPGPRDAGEWRHGDPPSPRPPFFDRLPEERQVVRRKTYALHPLTAADAADEMRQLDYDFHLYVDADTGQEMVVRRAEDGTVSASGPVGDLAEPEAVERLSLTGDPFLFYRDAATGRATVAYRRYNGHYGLITGA